eukprot:TRINITY_DN24222_c0_g1_i2.p1 TRINITY_DN24222_c0_g1~~TRINITY_DN24222_c0_g1_i2.p1  ORF type:complete len:767 (+),score=224.42 TRINITY_DN24222_c0_g1_i2:119-2302(+)
MLRSLVGSEMCIRDSPRAKPGGTAILIDVGRTMAESDGGWKRWVELVERQIERLVLFDPKHMVAIVLTGSDRTNNEMEYDGVADLHPLEVPSMAMLKKVRGIVPGTGVNRSDLTGGIMTAMGPLMGVEGRKTIMVLTDGLTAPSDDDLETITAHVAPFMESNNMQVTVVGMDLLAYQTEAQKRNTYLLGKLPHEMLSLETKASQLAMPQVRPVGVTTKFRGQMFFGDKSGCGAESRINVWAYALAVEKKFPSATRIIARSSTASETGKKAVMDRNYMYKHPDIGTDEENERFEKEELSKAFSYGREVVPFTEFDEANLKHDPGPKGIVVLAQLSADKIQPHMFQGAPDLLIPEPNDLQASTAMAAVVISMRQNHKVLVVRWVARANSAQKLHVLLPYQLPRDQVANPPPGPERVDCFVCHALPFMEDVRHLQLPRLGCHPTEAQQGVVSQLVDAMALPEDSYRAPTVWNPALHYFHTAVGGKALDPHSAICPPPPILDLMLASKPAITASACEPLKSFKSAFPLDQVVDPKVSAGKRTGFLAGLDDDQVAQHIDAAKKAKIEDGVMTVESLKPTVPSDDLKIKPGNPVADFVEMISRTDADLWDKAVLQLSDMVFKLVKDSVKDMNYAKALVCVTSLRKNSLGYSKPASFNSVLHDVRSEFRGHHQRGEFWEQLVGLGTTLISSKEHPDSFISVGEAETFLKPAVAKKEIVAEVAPIATDDLLDELE